MNHRGFTLLEIVIALAVAGLVMALGVPAAGKFYESMQYRAAVRDVITVLSSARHKAIKEGRAQDVAIKPETNEITLAGKVKQLPEELGLSVSAASELNKRDTGVIRFYPEGGSSGGAVDITLPGRAGVQINVDWLVGGISQESHALN